MTLKTSIQRAVGREQSALCGFPAVLCIRRREVYIQHSDLWLTSSFALQASADLAWASARFCRSSVPIAKAGTILSGIR